ncbi:MAG: helix-turn-helix domain-containing protein [Anaerolineae bacterium]|nr:helix-turn-helix domain-containing protein [Anaerolineae bacterium]
MKKVELILHPVRFRIMQTIDGNILTTQEIADQMSDIPKSSIYRQLKILLDGGMISVAETRLVNGIQEKTYQMAQKPYLNAGDVANLSAEEHIHYFTIYVMNVLREFADYMQRSETETGSIDMLADRVGYTEVAVYATRAELDVVQAELNAAIMKLVRNEPGNGRSRHKFAIITHPVKDTSEEQS